MQCTKHTPVLGGLDSGSLLLCPPTALAVAGGGGASWKHSVETGSGDRGVWGCAGEGVDVWLHAALWTEDVVSGCGGKSRSEAGNRQAQAEQLQLV